MVERIGQQLGNYRLVKLIGKGGFAEVYIGEHIYLKNQVAVKVLHAHMGEVDLETFLREARTLVKLIHPHIIRVLDFGVDNDTPFLVMDYAQNGTLRQHYPLGARMPLPLVSKYIKQMAQALQYAHEQKLIHRDVKPENMLLDKNDDALLSDFGVATIAQSSHYPSMQEQGGTAGTVAYMAPEQIQGQARPASDQYALAIVAYEWISGERPFRGTFTEVAVKHALAVPPPLREMVPDLPLEVEQVIMTALAKAPENRFGSIQAFAKALEQAIEAEGETIPLPLYAPVPGVAMASSPQLPPRPPEVRVVPAPARIPITPRLIERSNQRNPRRSLLIVLSVLLILLLSIGTIVIASKMVNSPTRAIATATHTASQPAPTHTATAIATATATATPGITPTPTPGITPTPLVNYPAVTGHFSGLIHNTLAFISSHMTLQINQNQGAINGQFTVDPPLSGSGPFTGSVDTNNTIEFTVTSPDATAPIFFQGTIQSDYSMSGTYCSINAQKQCDTNVGGRGTWQVSKDS